LENKRLIRTAGGVGALTLLSRVFGLLRMAVITALLGTGSAADAWAIAFMLPNSLRRLVGEGNISAAFVPVFTRLARQREEYRTWELAQRFHTAVAIAAVLLALGGVLAAPVLVHWFASGFAAVPGKIELTIRLTRFVFLYLVFISMAAVLVAVLNARDRFAAAAFVPVLLNVSIVGAGVAAWWAGVTEPVRAVWIIAIAAVLGGAAQYVFLIPYARRLGMRVWPRRPTGDPALRQIGKLMVPGLFGVGIIQINIIVGRTLASQLGEGAVASLDYAARINELTLGVFAISVATVVLPLMSRQGAATDLAALRDTLVFALRQISLVTVPAAVGMILLRYEIVQVLYQRGQFDVDSTQLTAAALWGYAVGLVAVATVRVVAPAFFALRDPATPVRVAAIAMLVNIIACLALRSALGNAGIALANSIAATANAALLLILFRRSVGVLHLRELGASLARIIVAAAIMGWVVGALRQTVWYAGAGGNLLDLGKLLAVITVGGLTYVAALAAIRAPEIRELRSVIRGGVPDTLTPRGGASGGE
jgi:putative peptidoglycan lipid II flippase